jgi:hypothetical protein
MDKQTVTYNFKKTALHLMRPYIGLALELPYREREYT